MLSILLWKASEHRLSRDLPRPLYLRQIPYYTFMPTDANRMVEVEIRETEIVSQGTSSHW